MDKIPAYGMSPMHISKVGLGGKRAILKKQMIDAVKINHAVWVVHPMFSRSKMNLRAMRLIKYSLCLACNIQYDYAGKYNSGKKISDK
jgi:hypothetical protein